MADKPIRVTILRPGRRKFYIARWTDPETGRQRSQSTGHVNRRDAERWAAKLEADLNAGDEVVARRMTWEDFRRRVERDFMHGKRPATQERYRHAMNALEREVNPKLVTGINADAIAAFRDALKKRGNADSTIAAALRHLKAILRWGVATGLLRKAPAISLKGFESSPRGRPLTDFEFLKLLAATKRVVGPERCESWRHLLRGMWLGGLRIGEAYKLTWDDPDGIRVKLDGKFPLLFIPAHLQKGRKFTVTPLTPDFAEFLSQTPKRRRKGFVFNPMPGGETRGDRITQGMVAATVRTIGKRAKIITKRSPVEYASAHDLRRSFCFRWSQRVLPQHLKTLARHAAIETTLKYYAEADAGQTAEAVWEAAAKHGVKTGDTGQSG